MTLTRPQTIEGLDEEWVNAAAFIAGLSDAELERPTRCEGWSVRNVAAHLVGAVADIAGGTVGAVMGPDHVADRATLTGPQLAGEMTQAAEIASKLVGALDDHYWAQPSPFPGLTYRQGVEALWLESFLHEDDIRHALGREPRPAPGKALEISLRHVAEVMGRHGWNKTTLALDGLPEIPIGPGGKPITGDPMRFLLAATGRIPAAEVGVDEKVNIYRG